ncbi:MAG TPA: flagellar hook-basal body protein [Bacillales bacterium]|nr:flagellar hook-basal body protein [Bacillales bacterium]
MNTGMIAASVTMGQLQKKLDTIGNNLSNLNTYGYKSREVQFSDLLFQQVDNLPHQDQQRLTPDGIRVGYGAKAGETNLNLEPGSIKQTGRSLDIALRKPSQFFMIDTNNRDSPAFTRDGSFYLQPDAANPNVLNLVTKDGAFVSGANGHIQIPSDYKSIQIKPSGQIDVTLRNGQHVASGRITLAHILRPQLLESIGHNRLAFPNLQALNLNRADVVQAVAPEGADMKQGALETSNVSLIQEMTQMLNVQRAYELNARAVTISDESMKVVNNIR